MRIGNVVMVPILIVAVVVASLFVGYTFMYRPHLPILIPPKYIDYGYLYCNDDVIIPGGSIIVLYYHPHGDVEVNEITIYVTFPAGIISEALGIYSKLPNPSDAMLMGVYVNGKLMVVSNNPSPIETLNETSFFWGRIKALGLPLNAVNTAYYVYFPTINLTPRDTIAVVIYSAVPYALPTCRISNETEEVKLMVKNHWIGLFGLTNATPTAQQLYEEGKYIVEEPTIYLINITRPINELPQELTQTLLANAKPFANETAPSYAISQDLSITNDR